MTNLVNGGGEMGIRKRHRFHFGILCCRKDVDSSALSGSHPMKWRFFHPYQGYHKIKCDSVVLAYSRCSMKKKIFFFLSCTSEMFYP